METELPPDRGPVPVRISEQISDETSEERPTGRQNKHPNQRCRSRLSFPLSALLRFHSRQHIATAAQSWLSSAYFKSSWDCWPR